MIPSDFQRDHVLPDGCDFYVRFEEKDFKKGHNDKGFRASSVDPKFVKEEGVDVLIGVDLTFRGVVSPTDAKSQALQVSAGPFLKNFLYDQDGLDSKKVEIVAIDSKGQQQLKLTLEADGKYKVISPTVEMTVGGSSLYTEVKLRAPKTRIDGHQGTTFIPFDVTKLEVVKK